MTQAQAEAEFAALGLVVGDISEAHDDLVPAGHIMTQDPEAGTKVAKNTAVNLEISLGPETGEGEGAVEGEGEGTTEGEGDGTAEGIATIMLKENAGVSVADYPVSAVVPLPQGTYASTATLGIEGQPSQVEVLNRWPDESLRNVLVHFQASVPANGKLTAVFDESAHQEPETPVTVQEAANAITITTGPLRFVVNTGAFNVLDQVWLDQNSDGQYGNDELILDASAQQGGIFVPRAAAGAPQYDTGRTDLTVAVEESGPMRAAIRIEAPARFVSATNHQHGFAVRIYAYAGKPFVKVDYQLANSDKTVVKSWPLYFEEFRLDFGLNLNADRMVRFGRNAAALQPLAQGADGYIAQDMHNHFAIYGMPGNTEVFDSGALGQAVGPEGLVDVSDGTRGVMAAIRNFWQMWPNGLAVDGDTTLSVQLFPAWSAYYANGVFSSTGLYWLDDMQHTYKEVLLDFHGAGATDQQLIALAKTFQFAPTAIPNHACYRAARATLDLGGIFPPDSVIPHLDDERRPFYHTEGYDIPDWYNAATTTYGAGWTNFWDPEPGYRSEPCTPGGWPYTGAQAMATSNPGDYFTAEGHALAELNLRPEWMAQFNFEQDWPALQLSENPYCGGRWRIFEGNGISRLAAAPLENTFGYHEDPEAPLYGARDDQHGWFYHVAETYFLTGNPWMRDWYQFVGQFRRARLGYLELFPDTSNRATGHALHHAMQAYRVTGDIGLLEGFQTYINEHLRTSQDVLHGDQQSGADDSSSGFQTGYLMRAVADYLSEVRNIDMQAWAEGFQYLSSLVEWNYHFGNFPYYFNIRNVADGPQGVSDGSGLTLVDPQAWYYWNTGKEHYLDQIDEYIASGLNGGEPPYGNFTDWRGQFEGRYYLFVKNTPRPDSTPPAAVTTLAATRNGDQVTVTWTAPPEAARYHLVWANKSITGESTTSAATLNWWAANVIAVAPGSTHQYTFDAGAGQVYVALFSFDDADNMSEMSNVAHAQ